MASIVKPTSRTRAAPPDDASPPPDPVQLNSLRDLFWHNVVREMLTGLLVAATKRPELLDGRFAILTHQGERIPIARVEPVFGYTVRGNAGDRRMSAAIQMTVFRVATPDGEVFTLPIHQVRAFHELTPDLLERIERAEEETARAAGDRPDAPGPPFGFAAFAALPRLPDRPPPDAAPMHPTE